MPARLSLNLFSPLPPLHSEIGNHTVGVAAALLPMADVTLWTAQDEVPELPAGIPVVHYDPARMDWARLNRADATIYNMGNNATFHRAMFDVARAAPGIVVLHDTRLQHFFARYSETPGVDRAFYLDSMRRCHGLTALADAQRWLAGEEALDTLVERYPMTASVLESALAAVVHNPAEQAVLAGQTRAPVFHLPLASPAGPPPPHRPGTGGRLVVFGYLGHNRRLGPLLDALATVPELGLELDIYGAMESPEQVDAQVARLDLGSRVRRHGFVPAAELDVALARADLAINLRFPSMGEASASQLRIWGAALPSLVTRTGWYAALPEDAVFFVEPEREVDDIREHLLALRQDPDRFKRAGLRGRAVLEAHHAPTTYAEGLLGILGQAEALHARRTATDLSRLSARILLDLTDSNGIALCATPLAQAVASLTGG